MEKELSWYEKFIIPSTKAYKNFVNEMKNISPEEWFKDGERIFTEKEQKYLNIYENKEKEIEKKSHLNLFLRQKDFVCFIS